jgi:Probable zinc-ribbon domain
MFEIHESESIPSIEVRRAQAVRFLQDAVIAMGSTAAVVVLLGEMLERSETPEQTNTQTFCIDCGDDFVITAGEAEWHAAKRLSLPRRCRRCREQRKRKTRNAR